MNNWVVVVVVVYFGAAKGAIEPDDARGQNME